jgi:glycosyltransferase involved in cell wall biosynthesis
MPVDGVYVTLESSPYGGGHEAIRQSLLGYEKRGLDVRVVCPHVPRFENCLPNSIPVKLESLVDGQNPMEYSGRTKRIYELCEKATPIIRKLKPDVIISHTYHAAFLLENFPEARRIYRDSALKKYMLEVGKKHGVPLPYGDEQIEELIKIENKSIENCDFIKTTSKSSVNWLTTEYKIDNSKIRLIPEAVDTSKFKKVPSEPNGRILYAGRCSNPIKGFNVLLRALKTVRKENGMGLQVDVVGLNNPFEHYGSLINELGLEKSINYRGFVPHDKMPSVYSETNLLVVPSFFEGFGMVCTEGMGSETPVIASDVGGLKDQLEGWDEQKFTPGNFHELADKIEMVFNGDYNLSEWAQHERKRVETKYELSKIIDMEIQAFFD